MNRNRTAVHRTGALVLAALASAGAASAAPEGAARAATTAPTVVQTNLGRGFPLGNYSEFAVSVDAAGDIVGHGEYPSLYTQGNWPVPQAGETYHAYSWGTGTNPWDITPVGAASARVTAQNASDTVLVDAWSSNGVPGNFLWEKGTTVKLPASFEGVALDAGNDAVGYQNYGTTNDTSTPAIWRSATKTLTAIPQLAGGTVRTIDAVGDVLGFSSSGVPTLVRSGVATALSLPDGAAAVSTWGFASPTVVYGNYQQPGGPMLSSVWNLGTTATRTDFVRLAGGSEFVSDVNASGQAAGSATTAAGLTHPVLWSDPAHPVDLAPASAASGGASRLNAKSQVVGTLNDRAFFWSGGVLTNLTPGANVNNSAAFDINDSGLVVGDVGASSVDYFIMKAAKWQVTVH